MVAVAESGVTEAGDEQVTRADGPSRVEASESRQIDAVLRGDERAFRELYLTHGPPLYRLALSLARGLDADAEDIVQEAWRRAVKGLDGFERRSSLRTWLRAIVVRCALEKQRSEGRGSEVPPEAAITSRGAPGSGGFDLERAFEQLPPGFRTVLVLHDLVGYRHTDIAELLGISEGTSKSQLSRARARMRELLGDDYARE